VNILVLTLLHGRQLGWICLASCGVDVIVNSMAICSITQSSQSTTPSETPLKVADQALHPMKAATSPSSNNSRSRQTRPSVNSTHSEKVPGRKCFICSPFKGLSPLHLPAFTYKNGERLTLPLYDSHRQSAYLDTQSPNRLSSLSKIGHFAVTQIHPEGGLATRRESTVFSDDHQRKSEVDPRRWSGEQTVLATIRKPLPTLSSSSDRDSPCSTLGRNSSYGHEAIRNVMQVIPVLQRTDSPDWSTSTKEFEETGTKIEFRCPLEVDEDQEVRVSEDLVAAAAAPYFISSS
jgi:hypothetical protein